MHCSVAKFVVDAEQCAMAYRMAEGIRWDDFDEALAAVRDVGPGGHYLGHPHTLERIFSARFSCRSCSTTTRSSNGRRKDRRDHRARPDTRPRNCSKAYEEPKLDAGWTRR